MVRKVSAPRKAPVRSADQGDQEARDDWALVDRLGERNADKTAEEVLADATAAVDAVRRARRARSRGTLRPGSVLPPTARPVSDRGVRRLRAGDGARRPR